MIQVLVTADGYDSRRPPGRDRRAAVPVTAQPGQCGILVHGRLGDSDSGAPVGPPADARSTPIRAESSPRHAGPGERLRQQPEESSTVSESVAPRAARPRRPRPGLIHGPVYRGTGSNSVRLGRGLGALPSAHQVVHEDPAESDSEIGLSPRRRVGPVRTGPGGGGRADGSHGLQRSGRRTRAKVRRARAPCTARG
jgi:hypothetical protein